MKFHPLSERKNVFFGVILSYAALAISLLGSFFITPIVLNNIGDRNYGLLSFCNSITTWLLLISEALGASYVFFATKEANERGSVSRTNTVFKKSLFSVSGGIVLISVMSSLALKVSGFQFSKYSAQENDLIFILLCISGLNVASNVFFSVFKLYSSYKKSFVFIRSSAIVVSLLSYAGNVCIALNTQSIVLIASLTFGLSIAQGLLNLFYAIRARKMMFDKICYKESKEDFNSVFKYSGIVLISFIIGNLDSNLDQTLLGIMVNAESVTMYHLSLTFMASLTTLSWSIVEVMRPTIYKLYCNEEWDAANKLFLKICKIQSIIVVLIVGGFISCGYHLVEIWLGSQRINVFFYSTALFMGMIVPLTKQASSEAYRAKNIHRITTKFSAISITINLVLSVVLIILLPTEYAVWACIIGTIIPQFIFSCIVVPFYDRIKLNLPVFSYFANLLKIILYACIALIPSIVLTLYFNNNSINGIFKVLIEGTSFVLIYGIETLLFEKETVRDILSTYFKKGQ